MGIILDVIILALVAIFVLIGAKRGFAKTAVETVGFFLSVYLAFSLCTPISQAISDSTIKPVVEKNIAQAISSAEQTASDAASQTVWDALPPYVQNLAQKANITPDTISQYVGDSSSNGNESVAAAVTQNVVMPLVYNLVKITVAVILFILLLIITKIIAVLIGKVFKLPVLKNLNSTVGAIFGGVQGVLIAVVLCLVVSAAISINSKGFLIFTQENIEASNLFKWICSFSPFN